MNVRGVLATAICASAFSARGDVFNLPNPETSLQFVTVGDPGNAPDTAVMTQDSTTGYGSVSYVYQMGKYDVTAAQYTAFLNAVAATDQYGLYNSSMATGLAACGISRSGSSGSYTYSTTGNSNFPVNYVGWGDAGRFCNWLQNSQPNGAEGNGTTETGAYSLNGATSNATLLAVTRNSTATYAIPTENEWYKAAYYVGGGTNAGYWSYPTQSNTAPSNVFSATGTNNANYYNGSSYTDPTHYLTPVGSLALSPGAYGTYDMGGDVWQWNEAVIDGTERGFRGGSWRTGSDYYLTSSDREDNVPTGENSDVGFRIVEVPEPGSIALLLAGTAAMGLIGRRRKTLDRGIGDPHLTS